MYLYLRPGLFDFLDALHDHFELVLFNTESHDYTLPLVEVIIKNQPNNSKKYFSYILCKEQCSVNDDNNVIKNIDLWCNFDSNREIEDALIIDNSIYCFMKSLTNGLLVAKYEG
jgi:TFIIF-interacting CTD phosphatase-like protein